VLQHAVRVAVNHALCVAVRVAGEQGACTCRLCVAVCDALCVAACVAQCVLCVYTRRAVRVAQCVLHAVHVARVQEARTAVDRVLIRVM